MAKKDNKRKGLSKKLRFEVFKRDGFKCVYCGKAPPEITLEIDHVDPISKGGENDINNLVSACFDCNRGKANVHLTKIPNNLSENLEVLKEQEEQLKEYRKYLKKISKRIDGDIKEIESVYIKAFPDEKISDLFKTVSLKRFLKYLSVEEIIGSLNMSISRIGRPENNEVLRYFCGICWNKIKEGRGDT